MAIESGIGIEHSYEESRIGTGCEKRGIGTDAREPGFRIDNGERVIFPPHRGQTRKFSFSQFARTSGHFGGSGDSVSGGFNPREILEIMEREKVTFSSLVPTMYTMILQVPDKDTFDTTSVSRLLVSSSPLMSKTKDDILAFFKNSELFEGYGATETGLVTCLRPEDQYHTVRSCGKVAPFSKIKILNKEGQECAPGEVG